MVLLKYYYDLMSQPSRAMYIILKISKTPFESCPVALRKMEQHTKDYEKNVNRFKKVPCIVDNGFQLSESVAILRYLEKDISKQLYPTDKQSRGRIDEYLEWQHNNTRMGCSMYFLKTYLEPTVLGIETNPKEAEMFKKIMEKTLDLIENVWLLNNQKFLCGNILTAADIFAACEIEQVAVTKYNVTENRPKLKAWLKAVKEATNPHYDEAHKFIYKLALKQSKL